MPDIMKCENETCPIKEKCYRYTSEPSKFWQSWGDLEYDDGCEYFLLDTKADVDVNHEAKKGES